MGIGAGCGLVCQLLKVLGTFVVGLYLGLVIGDFAPWNPLFQPLAEDPGRAAPYDFCSMNKADLSANATGVEVLIYAPARVGTKQTIGALRDLGFRNAFHSEDFVMIIWHRLVQAVKGKLPPSRKTFPPRPADFPLMVPTNYDLEVQDGLRQLPQDETNPLQQASLSCNVKAIAFDGMEGLFWDFYALNPNAKVISLSWRSWEKWEKSWIEFSPAASFWVTATMAFCAPQQTLGPLSAVIMYLLEYLDGGAARKWLLTGHPGLTEKDDPPGIMWFGYQTWGSWYTPYLDRGLRIIPRNKTHYVDFFEEPRSRIPKDKLFEFNILKNTHRDLCNFIGIDSDGCTDTLVPNDIPSHLIMEQRSPWASVVAWGCLLPMHYLHYKLVSFLLGYLCCCCRCRRCCPCCRRQTEKPKGE